MITVYNIQVKNDSSWLCFVDNLIKALNFYYYCQYVLSLLKINMTLCQNYILGIIAVKTFVLTMKKINNGK
jgi:hypothetical protein